MEIWKTVKGYEGFYEVSNEGRVRRFKTCRILKPIAAIGGYKKVHLSTPDYGKKKVFIHRLVATAFLGNPSNKEFVNHKNGVKNDNTESNLEWCTNSENQTHSFRVLKNRNGRSRMVLDLSNGVIYNSIKEAAIRNGYKPETLIDRFRGKLKNNTQLILL